MKKLFLLILFLTISSICFAGLLTKHDYVLKKNYGDYIIYILPNGMMYQYEPEDLTIEEMYLNSISFELFKFKSAKSAEKFIKNLGTIRCTTLKGIGKCQEPKKTEE